MWLKEKIELVIGSLKELIAIYPWLKMALTSVVGVLGGSSFITFINTYAIYNYAVSYGGRLPVENVPYIDIAISVLSFAFLAISLICALLLYGLLTYIAEALHRKFKSVPQTILKFISGIFTSIISALVSWAVKYFTIGGDSVSTDFEKLEFAGVVFIFGLVLGSLIVWKSFIRTFALIASILLVFSVALKLFDAKNYASFLREIQYGGGVPVTLTLKNGKEKGYLFLTTETTSIIWSPNGKSFIETPVSNINEIEFHEAVQHEMPEISGSLARIFRHLWK